jgi:hypothetical protein
MEVARMFPSPAIGTLAAPATHAPRAALSPGAALLLGAAGAAVVLWLWLRARYLRRRLSRAFTRSLSYGSSRRQLKSLRKRKVLARASRALLRGVEDADGGGVHGADVRVWERPAVGGDGGALVGEVSPWSARCRRVSPGLR